MRALFYDLAALQHIDQIRLLDGREPVSNDQAGTALQQLRERLLDMLLRFCIKGSRSLIENDNARIFQNRSGN
ncbi:hypothetical protein D3C79_1025420 [compost metagenome]